mgnify:FL=1
MRRKGGINLELFAEPVLPVGAELGEGPVWHEAALWFVDIEGKRLHRFDPASGEHDHWDAGQRIGVAAPASDGRWAVGLEDCLGLWNPATGELERLCAPEPDRPRNRFNDGKCDPRGRLFAGTMSMDAEPGQGALYRIGPTGDYAVIARNATISNGLAWNAALETMYYIDSPTRRVDAFQWDSETGDVSDRRPVFEFDENEGVVPDGMCIDAEGRLWVALWGGGAVVCVDPGECAIVDRVRVATDHTTSCCFGGPDLADLYITTARRGLSADALARQPAAGAVVRARPGVQGLPVDVFRLG